MTLLLRHGYAATSMEAIASHAGVAKKTAYRFAQNRDELIALAVRSWTDPFVPALEHDPDDAEDVIPTLRALLYLICAQALSEPAIALFRLLTTNFPGKQDLLHGYQRNGIERARTHLARWFARQHERKLLHCSAADETARLVLAMAVAEPLRQAALESSAVADADSLRQHVDHCLRLLDGTLLRLNAHPPKG